MDLHDLINSYEEFKKENENIPQVDITNAFDDMQWYIDRIKQYGKLWFDTCYPEIDKDISWVIPWKVYTIAAYSNVGKSRFAYSLISHFLKQGKKILFFNLEVNKWMALLSILLNYYDITYEELVNWYEYNIWDFANLTIYDNIYDLAMINKTITFYTPEIVFIDFVQNIITSWGSEYEKMSIIARKIQQMAISNKCVIFSLSQLSNSVAKDISKGETDFITLKWAWEFVASSDVIFLMRKLKQEDSFIMAIKIIKNKFGRVWEEYMYDVDFAKSKFRNKVYSFM